MNSPTKNEPSAFPGVIFATSDPSSQRRSSREVQAQLRDLSHPDFDFFLLVLLSSVIATLGLLIDSPAVIIGAMLVSPLMSPILDLGLASIRGDRSFAARCISALLRGRCSPF